MIPEGELQREVEKKISKRKKIQGNLKSGKEIEKCSERQMKRQMWQMGIHIRKVPLSQTHYNSDVMFHTTVINHISPQLTLF